MATRVGGEVGGVEDKSSGGICSEFCLFVCLFLYHDLYYPPCYSCLVFVHMYLSISSVLNPETFTQIQCGTLTLQRWILLAIQIGSSYQMITERLEVVAD